MTNASLDFPLGELFDDTENVITEDDVAFIECLDTLRPDPANKVLVPGELMNTDNRSVFDRGRG